MQETNPQLEALINGDNKAIREIYDMYFPKVRSFILQNKGKDDDVQDVFHDALIYLITTHKEKPLQIRSFEAYFFTICKNIWRRTLKKDKKQVMNDDVVTLVDKETDLSLFILEQKRLEFYKEKFQLLSENCREILGNYFNGMSYEEILEDLAYASINTVRQRVFKCKAKIIQLIKADKRFRQYSYE
ncbi:MAG: sigma-70 family RNA polymerase sigma factor [Flavobacteriaceae bacterium]|nr:sigma-70 family RNA polymerase sigma factor [Flavobacteriaceae bacterium]